MAGLFINLSVRSLDLFINFIQQHEFFSFCCIEPYMVCVLGNGLLFKVILPLHREGMFTVLMEKVKADKSKFDVYVQKGHLQYN